MFFQIVLHGDNLKMNGSDLHMCRDAADTDHQVQPLYLLSLSHRSSGEWRHTLRRPSTFHWTNLHNHENSEKKQKNKKSFELVIPTDSFKSLSIVKLCLLFFSVVSVKLQSTGTALSDNLSLFGFQCAVWLKGHFFSSPCPFCFPSSSFSFYLSYPSSFCAQWVNNGSTKAVHKSFCLQLLFLPDVWIGPLLR